MPARLACRPGGPVARQAAVTPRPGRSARPARGRAAVAASSEPSSVTAPSPPPSSGCPLGFGAGDVSESSPADGGASTSAPTLAATGTPIPVPASGPDAHAASLPLAPGTKGLPFIGETFEMFKDIPGFHARRLAKHGAVYRSHALGAPLTCVADAGQVRRLLLGEAGAAPITATDWTPAVRALLGPESLLMKSGASHAASRRILAQAFTGAAVDAYQPLVREATERAVAGWAAETAARGALPGLAAGKDLAFEIAARALIAGSMDQGTMDAFREDFDLFTLGFFGIPVALPGTAFRRALAARERVLARIDALIDAEAAAIAAAASGGATSPEPAARSAPTALRLMMTADDPERPGSKIGRGELRDQVVTQLFAGHETTVRVVYSEHGTTIARLMAFVTADNHPAVLAALRAEQESVAASHGPDLTPAAVAAMPYLEAVIKETNRLFPIVSGVFRKALVDLDVCGYRVPAGERVMLMLGQTQREIEEFKGDLASFRPERWLSLARDPPAWMPWGAGPHICLGMGLAQSEIRVVLAALVRGYEWAPVDPGAVAAWRAPLQPADGVPVQVWRRGTPRPPPAVVVDKVAEGKAADAWWVAAA